VFLEVGRVFGEGRGLAGFASQPIAKALQTAFFE
jgi:hypothetical protein